MKRFLILAFAIGWTNTFGQTPINKSNEVVSKFNERLQNDTSVITVIVVGYGTNAEKTAYFLNDRFIKYPLLSSINSELIESLKVIDTTFEIDSIKYDKQIRLIAKNNYFPKAISLTNLKEKYYPGGLKNQPVIFMIDGNIVHGDYNKYEIDENNLYAISLYPENATDKIRVQFVKLTTKSEASIKLFKSVDNWMTDVRVKLTK